MDSISQIIGKSESRRFGVSYPDIALKWKETGLSFQVQFIKKNFTANKIGGKIGGKVGGKVNLQDKIINLITNNPAISINDIAKKTGISKRNCERIMAKLKETGTIKRSGSSRSGYWIAIKAN